MERAQARFRQLRHLVRQLLLDRCRGKPRPLQYDLRLASASRPDRGARHRAGLRSGQGNVPAGPLHQGRVPEVRREGPVRRQLRSLRLDLSADRTHQPVLGRLGRDADPQDLDALLLPPLRSALRGLPARLGERPRAARSDQQDARMARRQGRSEARRLGHFARRALLRLRDSGRAGQVLLRLGRCAGRLLRELQESRGLASASISTHG